MSKPRDQHPLVYSCSGCSSAAQLANHVALQLDRRGVAEMSCIAGVGGDVSFIRWVLMAFAAKWNRGLAALRDGRGRKDAGFQLRMRVAITGRIRHLRSHRSRGRA